MVITKKQGNFEYNSSIDSLTIFSDNSEMEPVKGSIEIGTHIFDIGTSGSFVSLEIDNASEALNLSPSKLRKIKNAKIKTIVNKNMVLLAYSIAIASQQYQNSLVIPKDKIQLSA